MTITNYLSIFYHALKTNIKIVNQDIYNKLLDTSIWISAQVFANAFLLTKLGVSIDYASYVAVGALASCGCFQSFTTAMTIVGDLTGNRTINYELMLPLPSWAIFLKIGLSWCTQIILLSTIILPIGKLILWQSLDLSNFNILLFIPTYLILVFMFGMLGIFSATIPDNLHNVDRVWVRYIFPAWFFGGALFPYITAVKSFPVLSWILLLNPIVYASEAIRNVVLGSNFHYLPLSSCLIAMTCFAIIFLLCGFYRFKRKLDFI